MLLISICGKYSCSAHTTKLHENFCCSSKYHIYMSSGDHMKNCFLTQDFGSLIGSVRQRPVGCVVVPSQFDVQLTSERLVVPSCNQPAALKQHETQTSTQHTVPGINYQSNCVGSTVISLCIQFDVM